MTTKNKIKSIVIISLIIIIGIISGTILWADLTNIYVWTLIFVSLSLGGLGLLDDVLKQIKKLK